MAASRVPTLADVAAYRVVVFVCPVIFMAAALTNVELAVKRAPTDNRAVLTLVETLANPAIVVLPASSVLVIDAAPVALIVFAVMTQRAMVLPNCVPAVFEPGNTPELFAVKFVVVCDAALTVPVW